VRNTRRLGVLLTLAVVFFVGMTGFSEGADLPEWETPKGVSQSMVIPVSEEELMDAVRQALCAGGAQSSSIKKVVLDEFGPVYVANVKNGKSPVFARFVARRVPCGDCHDVFFVYSFDGFGFLNFIPISITKRYNQTWNDQDVAKIEDRFVGKPFQERLDFDPAVDAVTSATMSSKIVFHSLNETRDVYQKLVELGMVKGGD
jgi:hypothetical protein